MKRVITFLLVCIMLSSGVTVNISAEETGLKLGDYITLGKYNGEEIMWRYIADDENGKLFLSDEILCYKSFDSVGDLEGIETKGSHASNGNRQIMWASWKDGEIVSYQSGGSNYWGDSNIRSWLTSSEDAGEVNWLCDCPPQGEAAQNEKGFLHSDNFTNSEKSIIKTVYLDNYLDRADKNFAIKGSKYGLKIDYKDRIAEVLPETIFLLDIDQIMAIQKDGRFSSYLTLSDAWWTKTPYTGYTLSAKDEYSSIYSLCVEIDSSEILIDNEWIDDIGYTRSDFPKGVRPAFYINEENAQIPSGTGTKDDPYVIDAKKENGLKLGDYITLGKYNGEDVIWRYVLDDENGKLFLSDKVLCEKNYVKENGGGYLADQWAGSSIHYWLNSDNLAETWMNIHEVADDVNWKEDGFLHENNFTDTEKLVLKGVKHRCHVPKRMDIGGFYPSYNTSYDLWDNLFLSEKYFDYEFEDYQLYEHSLLPANTVIDRVFLPNVEEILAIYKNFGDYIATDKSFWLRTPELWQKVENAHFFAIKPATNESSKIEKERGFEFTHMNEGDNAGIRPMFYLNDDVYVIKSGTGEKEAPFALDGKCQDGLQLGDYITLGTFKGEKILWQYVADDENGKLFVSKRVLERKESSESITWRESNFREYLQHDFFSEKHFDAEDMKAVKTVNLETLGVVDHAGKLYLYPSAYSYGDEYKGEIMTDEETVFLLNYEQILNIFDNYAVLGDYLRYIDDEDEITYYMSPYTKEIYYYNDHWLLRDCASYGYGGQGGDMNYYYENWSVDPADSPYFHHGRGDYERGIRPAFYLNEEESFIQGGLGTESNPYVIKGKQPVLYEEKGLYGYKDENGNIITPAKYLKAGEFTNEAALVIQPEDPYRLYCIGTDGNYLFDKAFYAVNNFDSGYALTVINGKGEYSYIDKTGEVATDLRFECAGNFDKGLARVKLNGRDGVVDTEFNFYPDEICDDYSIIKEHKGHRLKFFANEQVIYEKVYDNKPTVEEVKEGIYKITEDITTIYVDVKLNRISEEYYYLLYAGGDYIVFQDGYDELVLADIFDKTKLYYIVKDMDISWSDFISVTIEDKILHVKYKKYSYEYGKHIPLTDDLRP